jgi:hypothetical protein
VQAFKCPGCDDRFSCLSGLLQHVENSNCCDERINKGTGVLGRLWLFLLDKFDMPAVNEGVDVDMVNVMPSAGRAARAQVMSH